MEPDQYRINYILLPGTVCWIFSRECCRFVPRPNSLILATSWYVHSLVLMRSRNHENSLYPAVMNAANICHKRNSSAECTTTEYMFSQVHGSFHEFPKAGG